jgi:DNA-binding transcriptional MerR regulator
MNNTHPRALTALQLFEPPEQVAYSIEAVAHLTQTPRFLIAVYCRHGLISPLAPPETEGWWFDDETIRTLRRIERLRADYGVNLHGLRMVAGLIEELEGLRAEARFLRGR